MLLLLCWSLHLLTLAAAETNAFLEPETKNNVEFYDDGDITYAIVLDEATFGEARVTCKVKNGSLLELHSEAPGMFVARALAESAVGFSAVWIGGEFTPGLRDADNAQLPGEWRWVSGDPIIKEPIPVEALFPLEKRPYWVDRPNLTMTRQHCLIMDRNLHDRPLTTALPCTQRRPYVCVLPKYKDMSKPEEVFPIMTVAGTSYHLFQAKLTWYEALGFCQSLHLSMAVVTKTEVFTKLQERMRRTRPILENAWIGGSFKRGKWTWVMNNEDISLQVVSKRNGTNGTENVYSPWYRPQNIAMEGCLLADRHLCEYFVFVEANCNRRRSVLCQENFKSKVDELIPVNETDLYISTTMLSWEDAQKRCQHCLGSNWTLLQLAFFNQTILRTQMQYVYKAMTEQTGREVRHMWLNSRMHDGRFFWGYTHEGVLIAGNGANMSLNSELFGNSSTSLLNKKGDDGFLFFCQDDVTSDPFLRDHPCLNLDRENQKHFFMYGLRCNFKQHFICAHGKYEGLNKDCQSKMLIYKNRNFY